MLPLTAENAIFFLYELYSLLLFAADEEGYIALETGIVLIKPF